MMNSLLRIERRVGGSRILAVLAAALVLSATSSWAAVSYDISVGLPIGDDAKLFLNITNEYYAPPQEVATVLVKRCPHPEDDYPAVLFLARASGRPPAEILDLRLRGQSWADIMFAIHVQPSVLFVGIDRDPGPPYGRAWGYFRRHPRARILIEDREFVEYAKLHAAAGYYKVRPWTIIAERQRGVTVERYVVNRHRGRGHGAERAEERKERRDEGDDEGNGKQKQHGNKEHGPKEHGDKPGKPR